MQNVVSVRQSWWHHREGEFLAHNGLVGEVAVVDFTVDC